MSNSTRDSGKVKFFSTKKGFGFIIRDGDSAEIFFHISEVDGGRELRENDRVTFGVKDGKKGLNATEVRPE